MHQTALRMKVKSSNLADKCIVFVEQILEYQLRESRLGQHESYVMIFDQLCSIASPVVLYLQWSYWYIMIHSGLTIDSQQSTITHFYSGL